MNATGRISQRRYSDVARGLGAYSERIEKPEEIVPAIQRGIEQTKEGKPRPARVHHPRRAGYGHPAKRALGKPDQSGDWPRGCCGEVAGGGHYLSMTCNSRRSLIPLRRRVAPGYERRFVAGYCFFFRTLDSSDLERHLNRAYGRR